jgi:hypothetical protein
VSDRLNRVALSWLAASMTKEAVLLLIDYSEYAKLVADAYAKAPAYDPAAVPAFEALIQHVEKMYGRINRKQPVEFVDGQPYDSQEGMKQKVQETGVLEISKDFNSHPLFSELANLRFRAVHDMVSHLQKPNDFSLKGEIAGYNAAAKMCPPKAVGALFSEVVAQAATYIVSGEFGPQKLALLPGFDYYNIGRVEGYKVDNKRLVKDNPGTP